MGYKGKVPQVGGTAQAKVRQEESPYSRKGEGALAGLVAGGEGWAGVQAARSTEAKVGGFT